MISLRNVSHLELLVALVGFLTIQSFMDAGQRTERMVVAGSFFVLVLSAIRSLSSSKWRLHLTLGLGVAATVGSLVRELSDHLTLVNGIYVIHLCILLILLVSLAESIFILAPASLDRIIGAVSFYLLLALAWAFLYTLLELNYPGTFRLSTTLVDNSGPALVNEMFYFSSASLTTLGFGDVVAVTSPGRVLSVIEAMTGQLYLAVVIAFLVGERLAESISQNQSS